MSAYPQGIFPVQPALGLTVGAPRQKESVFVLDEDIGDDLFEGGVFLDNRSAPKRMVLENKFQGFIKIG